MVTLTPMELQEIQQRIDQGELPKTTIKDHFDQEAKNVFGQDARKTRHGYVEQGIGSPQNQTRNSVEAYRKHGVGEPDYAENLKRMEQELVDSQQRRAQKVP